MARPREMRGPRGDLAEGLRAARAVLGVSQEKAAALLGVTRVTFARWETGSYAPLPLARQTVERWIADVLRKGRKVKGGRRA